MSRQFPPEFETILSSRGRRLLACKDKAAGVLGRTKFFTAENLIGEKWEKSGASILTRAFSDLLVPLERPLPSATDATESGLEVLPKVGRLWTTPMATSRETQSAQRAQECGLLAMLESESYLAFANALAGEAVRGPSAMQVLCYRAGDYAGPHTDHHPTDAQARSGYVDLHLTFCTRGVTQQFVVYERDGHLTETASVERSGTVTAYRLPFWHYTTPLQTTSKAARRWLVLGTFLSGSTEVSR